MKKTATFLLAFLVVAIVSPAKAVTTRSKHYDNGEAIAITTIKKIEKKERRAKKQAEKQRTEEKIQYIDQKIQALELQHQAPAEQPTETVAIPQPQEPTFQDLYQQLQNLELPQSTPSEHANQIVPQRAILPFAQTTITRAPEQHHLIVDYFEIWWGCLKNNHSLLNQDENSNFSNGEEKPFDIDTFNVHDIYDVDFFPLFPKR